MSSQAGGYYLPSPSYWPVTGSVALFLMAFGGVLWMNGVSAGPFVVLVGAAILIYMMFGWFGCHLLSAGQTGIPKLAR